nr:MAG TPA: hypothetical protein [Caudoviricetes sp.]
MGGVIDYLHHTITRPHLRPGDPQTREGVKTIARERSAARKRF